jgi:hypothetical protein
MNNIEALQRGGKPNAILRWGMGRVNIRVFDFAVEEGS